MRNCLYVRMSATNAVASPGDNIRFVRATTATNVEYSYIGDDGGIGTFDLTVNSGHAATVIKELCRLAASATGVYHIGDQVAGTYFHPQVTAIAAVAKSA